MDYRTMGDIFKGLASSGSWGCFDEFNRLMAEVLSVCTIQWKSVLDGIRAGGDNFRFNGLECYLHPDGCMSFITMNPGYLGRQELPESLKVLFRPVTVMVPDFQLIMENSEPPSLLPSLASRLLLTAFLPFCSRSCSSFFRLARSTLTFLPSLPASLPFLSSSPPPASIRCCRTASHSACSLTFQPSPPSPLPLPQSLAFVSHPLSLLAPTLNLSLSALTQFSLPSHPAPPRRVQ